MSDAKRILKNAGILHEAKTREEKVFNDHYAHANKTLKEISELLKALNYDVVGNDTYDDGVKALYKVNDGLQKAWSNLKHRKK